MSHILNLPPLLQPVILDAGSFLCTLSCTGLVLVFHPCLIGIAYQCFTTLVMPWFCIAVLCCAACLPHLYTSSWAAGWPVCAPSTSGLLNWPLSCSKGTTGLGTKQVPHHPTWAEYMSQTVRSVLYQSSVLKKSLERVSFWTFVWLSRSSRHYLPLQQ